MLTIEQILLLVILGFVVGILYGIRRLYILENKITALENKLLKKIKKR